jgi:hypothetical protein
MSTVGLSQQAFLSGYVTSRPSYEAMLLGGLYISLCYQEAFLLGHVTNRIFYQAISPEVVLPDRVTSRRFCQVMSTVDLFVRLCQRYYHAYILLVRVSSASTCIYVLQKPACIAQIRFIMKLHVHMHAVDRPVRDYFSSVVVVL